MRPLSASTLKLFQECPRCFWLHINQQIERPRGPFPSLPSGIDRILKIYFDGYRKRGVLPPLVAGKLDGTLSMSALTLGFDDARTKARLWGKLDDCLILDGGRLAPLDHKTRASAPNDISYSQQYYQLQMDVYTLLLERNGHATSRTAYLVYYFPTEGALHEGFPFETAVHCIPTDPDGAYALFLAACRCLQGPRPPSADACAYCRWVDARAAGHAAQPSDRPAAAIRRPRVSKSPRSSAASQAPSPIPDDLFA